MEALTVWAPGKLQALDRTARAIQEMQDQIRPSSNSAGGPGGPSAYIDASVMMSKYSHLVSQSTTLDLDMIEDAIVPLIYSSGYPEVPGGTPFWERLESEPDEYYRLFKAYRESTYIKHLKDPGNNGNNGTVIPLHDRKSLRSARSVYDVADLHNTDPVVARTLSQMYHWHQRAKAFDMYRTQHLEEIRGAEIEYMQGAHLSAARKIFNRCLQFLEDNPEELTAKTALEWFQTAVQLERLALGLPKDKPSMDDEGYSLDRRPWVMINQQLNQGALPESASGNGNGSSGTREDRVRMILNVLKDADALSPETIDVESEVVSDDES